MKIFLTLASILILGCIGTAQQASLPEQLVPGYHAVAEADRLGGRVVKLLPRGMFTSNDPGYKDEENQLGIRGGGSYYSFTTGLHSYNKIPQIGLEQGTLKSGFYGASYGLILDLGTTPLTEVSPETPGVVFLAEYEPPHLINEIYSEATKRGEYKANGFIYRSQLPAVIGHTYVVRAISFDEADTLVAFSVVAKNGDDSVELVWKRIKDFGVPRIWHYTDEHINGKLTEMLKDIAYAGITGSVKENVITLSGSASPRAVNQLISNFNSLRGVKINNQVKTISQPMERP